MKHQHLIALCLGIFAAAMLWQYYLWPKYQLKQESPEIMALIEETAQKEIENAVKSSELGEVLFVGEPLQKDLSNEIKKDNFGNTETQELVLDPATTSDNEDNFAYQEDDSRITMLQIPANFIVIKDSKSYKKFLSENKGNYPKINFKTEEIVLVLSADRFPDTFFEIVKVETLDNEIKVFYRVNLISATKGKEQKNYKLIKNTNLPVNFIQVK